MLTAAHCTRGHSAASVQVRVGEHDHTNSGADVYNVAAIDHHPGFQYETKMYDFSLLTLATSVNFSSKAAPICLPASVSTDYVGAVATIIGWGFTEAQGSPSHVLMEANLTVVSNTECAASHGSEIQKYFNLQLDELFPHLNIYDFSNHICATSPGKDACDDDSGGPMFLSENER